MHTWTKNFTSLLNLFLQSHCPLCQRSTSQEICHNCTKQLQKCQRQDRISLWQEQLPVFVWGQYGGPVKRAMAALKYENQPQIARPLGQWLGESWLLNSPRQNSQIVVVPIPLHASKQRQRKYNQAALIGQSFCQITGLKLKLNGLTRVRQTEAQFGLSVSGREQNLSKAFAVGQDFRHSPPNVPVLLVDDIYTTGATARSAVQTLREYGIVVLGLVAVATTVKDG